jgi:hypothetical protein
METDEETDSGVSLVAAGGGGGGAAVSVFDATLLIAVNEELMQYDYKAPEKGQEFAHGRVIDDGVFQCDLYDCVTGYRLDATTVVTARTTGSSSGLILDLRNGSHVMINGGPHRGSKGTVQHRTKNGHYKLYFPQLMALEVVEVEESTGTSEKKTKKKKGEKKNTEERWVLTDEAWHTVVGTWMIEQAMKGEAAFLPIVNYTP